MLIIMIINLILVHTNHLDKNKKNNAAIKKITSHKMLLNY